MIITIELDCHDHPWHEVDEEFPECGPDNLIRMAEQYGVLIRYLPDHEWSGWAWWYRITGPRENLVHFLDAEYSGGDDELTADIIEMWEKAA